MDTKRPTASVVAPQRKPSAADVGHTCRGGKVLYWLLRILCLGTTIITATICSKYVHDYGYNSVLADEFDHLKVLGTMMSGQIPFDILLRPHNHHLVPVGKLVFVGFGLLTRFNSVAQMYLSLIFIVATFPLICLITAQSVRQGGAVSVLCLVDALAIFSLRNYESLLYGVLVFNSMAVFFAVAAIYCLGRCGCARRTASVLWCVSALALALVASFSGTAATLALWPIGLLVLTFFLRRSDTPARKIARANLMMWTIGMVSVALVCVLNATAHASRPGFDAFRFVNYLILVTGSTLFSNPDVAILAGLGLVIGCFGVLVALIWQARSIELSALPAICLFLFGISSVALVTFGRSHEFGLYQALSPRYAQFGELALCGLLAVGAVLKWRSEIARKVAFGALSLMIAASYFLNLGTSEQIGSGLREARRILAYRLRYHEMQADDGLRPLHSVPALVRSVATELQLHKFNVFAENEKTLPGTPKLVKYYSSIDPPRGAQVDYTSGTFLVSCDAPGRSSVELTGWSVDPVAKAPGSAAFVRLSGYGLIPACYGLKRDDIFYRFGIGNCGFLASFSAKLLPAGTHKVSIVLVSADGRQCFESPTLALMRIASRPASGRN